MPSPDATPTSFSSTAGCGVVELRQYMLHPGRREALIELFDREFVETQEALGITVMGQFRDLDDADRFVWLRGFRDMAARRAALGAFYDGPVWRRHRDAANATMVSSDDVLLLRPAWAGAGVDMAQHARGRPSVGADAVPPGLVDAVVFHLHGPAPTELLALCRQTMSPALARGGARPLGWYVTEPAPNDFARLPVREGISVLVGLALFDSVAAHAAFVHGGAWTREVQPRLAGWLARPTESHRLTPTARSAIHA